MGKSSKNWVPLVRTRSAGGTKATRRGQRFCYGWSLRQPKLVSSVCIVPNASHDPDSEVLFLRITRGRKDADVNVNSIPCRCGLNRHGKNGISFIVGGSQFSYYICITYQTETHLLLTEMFLRAPANLFWGSHQWGGVYDDVTDPLLPSSITCSLIFCRRKHDREPG